MRCCTNLHRQLWAVALALLLPWLCISAAQAGGMQVRKAEVHFSGDSFQISADFDIKLNFVVEQALEQGVALYFVSEFTVTHPRWYWLDETVAQDEQTIKLSYNTLARQYRITRGALFQNFDSLQEALRVIGHQSSSPIASDLLKGSDSYLARKLLGKNSYMAAVRLHLDVTQLPKPLQVNALTGDDWNLDSDWFRWSIKPETSAHD